MSHRLSERDVARRAAGDAGRAATVRSQQGAGLIEVMVAIVVLSVGLLAIVLSQLNALRGQRSSHLRTAAVQMAGNMAERMRLNVASVNGSSGDYADPATRTYVSLIGSGTPASAPAFPTSFAGGSQSAYDLDAWRFDIGRRMGVANATGVVRMDAGQPMTRTVIVMWPEPQPTKPLSDAASLQRGNDCATGDSAEALVCDRGCPTDGTVAGAPAHLRCVQIAVQP
ncbi:hypothetical protein VARIO8X_110076 [Burkholderiales bacterium 8X]|nr:hypothetical protein VARIO8X_110076 [Burkholderiales bacterium 8X]